MTPHFYPDRNCWRLYVPAKLSGTGKRQAKYFDSKTAAQNFVRSFYENKVQPAIREVLVTERIRSIVEMAMERLEGQPEEILTAVDYYIEHFRAVSKKGTVQEMCNEFIAFQVAEGRSPRTLADDRYRMREFIKEFNHLDIRQLTKEKLLKWMHSYKLGTNRANMFKGTHKLLGWAQNSGWLGVDLMAKLERPAAKSAKEIIPIGQFEMMLRYAAGLEELPPEPAKLQAQYGYKLFTDFRPILPALVLGGFAGLRTGEMVKVYGTDQTVQWEDINWDEGYIHIRDGVAKDTKRENNQRHVPIEPAVIAWLKPIAKPAGPVMELAESAYREYRRQLVARMNFAFPKNGLRNSYASYSYSITGRGGQELAKAMGDLEETVRRHYIETLKPNIGLGWFGIRPETRKIVPMTARA